ncbi:MAG: sugar phosphate nucleotidyltransferase [Candidatus Doudnabacteria bacterium]
MLNKENSQKIATLTRATSKTHIIIEEGNPRTVVMDIEEYERLRSQKKERATETDVKGIILAGGTGTRLLPATKVTNKHLLPVYNKPMIYYPLQTLVNAGIKEVMIVTGGNSPGDFLRLLGNGKEFGLRELRYAYQEGAGGIAEALGLAQDFADNQKVVVILGDNIFEDNIGPAVKNFRNQKKGARIFLKKVPDANRFGVAEIKNGKIISIEEKPKIPKSNLAVTGIYMYDNYVYEIIKTLKPSDRGELEITDVNNQYIKEGTMEYEILRGWWTDAGIPETLYRATTLVRDKALNESK